MFDGNAPQVEKAIPPIVMRVDEIGKQLEELQVVINALEERLKPVLRPVVGTPKDPDGIEPKAPHSPLLDRLDGRTHKIFMLIQKSQDILSRLEV